MKTGSVTLLLAIVLAVALPSAAQAHRSSAYYDARWTVAPDVGVVDTDLVLDWAFSPTFEAEARDDAVAAAEAWNVNAGRLTFRHVADLTSDPGPGACPIRSTNVARRGPLDGAASDGGGILAIAAVCTLPGANDGIAYHFTVTYDEAEPWHFGPPPVPAARFDLQGILAHEFGHTTGWFRHFQENTGTECLAALRHTMCSSVAPGTADPRDLEPHDVDTWQDAY